MSLFLRILGQLLLILLGYAAASLVASMFFHLLFLGMDGLDPREVPPVVMGTVFVTVPIVALFISYFAFLPSAILVGLGEIVGARDWPFYAIGGGIVGACVIGLFWTWTPSSLAPGPETALPDEPFLADPYVLAALVCTGMVGGIAYWAVAGRLAGGWKTVATVPARSGS
ncbi:MAG: hypothetical protein M9939_10380 [Mesorhizobium sp.]|nr:hypothetical protein [Mesorhizobium sp.]MCO5161533.1 hypothetical protein [Mesorhizobium sp.]